MYINFKEMSLYQFASNTKRLQTLTHWNLAFTIVTLALKYVCHIGECSSNIEKCVVSATLFLYNNKLSMNNQSTKRLIYMSLFCYEKYNTKQGN